MEHLERTVAPIIESVYGELTPIEKDIANYFLSEAVDTSDLSASHVADSLHISVPSLTRFAKKCGFTGYRQFIYEFQEYKPEKQEFVSRTVTQNVLHDYGELLNKTYSLVDEAQFLRVGKLLNRAKRVYIYGQGSSGLVAQEMKFRFMRLGMICEAITDEHMIRMNKVLHDKSCLVIGISMSGQSKSITNAVEHAKSVGANTVLITANNSEKLRSICHELILVAVKDSLAQGNIISPQFPILLVTDIFYAYYKDLDRDNRSAIFTDTLSALDLEEDNN